VKITEIKSILMLGGLLFCWGSYAAVSKVLLSRLNFFQVQFYAFLFAFIALIIVNGLIKSKRDIKHMTRSSKMFILLAGILCYAYYLCYNFAISLIGASQASILNYTFPVWMVLLFAIKTRKMPGILSVFSVFLGFIGVFITLSSRTETSAGNLIFPAGVLLALAAALFWGVFSIIGAGFDEAPLQFCLLITAVCFAASTGALFLFSTFNIFDWITMAGLLWMGVFAIAIPYWLWFLLIERIGVEKMAVLSYLTPFSTLAFIIFLLGEKIYLRQLIGLIIIIAGCWVQKKFSAKSNDVLENKLIDKTFLL